MNVEIARKVKELVNKDIEPVYFEVAARLNLKLRDSKYMPWILARCMTVRQARISLALPDPNWAPTLSRLEVSDRFAIKLEIDKKVIDADIRNLYEKSFVHPSRKGPRPPTSFVEWFDLQNHTKFDAELGDEYFAAIGLMLDYEQREDREKALSERIKSGQPQIARILARWKSIEHIPGMLPGDDIREFLKANTLFGIIKCACRRRYKDRDCEQPDEVCLVMGRTAQMAIDRGTARQIGYNEALHLINNELVKYPVVHITARTDDPKKSVGLICSCHADCCVVLRAPLVLGSKYPVWEHYAKSRFRATVDPAKCNGCGLCAAKRCQFNATRLRIYPEYFNERAWMNEELCMGCGCCVETCPSGARGMKLVDPPETLKLPSDAKGLYIGSE